MNYFLFSFLIFNGLVQAEVKTVAPNQASENATYNYYDIVPNQKKTIKIQAVKCAPNNNELQIERFNSLKNVTDGKVDVVIVFIRAGKCKESPYSSTWEDKIVIKKSKKWTHLNIVSLSHNIMILN